jgi:hypothetical protein
LNQSFSASSASAACSRKETKNPDAEEHESFPAFATARIRIPTLDNAHRNLFTKRANKSFASHLRCLVLDEAHTCDGVFGANIHYFIKRVRLCNQLYRCNRPHFFLVSATVT